MTYNIFVIVHNVYKIVPEQLPVMYFMKWLEKAENLF